MAGEEEVNSAAFFFFSFLPSQKQKNFKKLDFLIIRTLS